MNPKEFEQIVNQYFKYVKHEDEYRLKPITKPCEDCDQIVTNRIVNCAMYIDKRFDNYFKHQCKNCKLVLFDGSKKRDVIRLKKARSAKEE